MRVAVCVIARMENAYIKEFIEHYKKLGVDKIFIYDNNHDGEEHFEDVIGDYIKQGFVDVIDFRNLQQVQNTAYNDCYRKHGKEYDWIIFCDTDEFLILEKHGSIKAFLKDKTSYECVLISWKCMTDNNLIEYENKPLMERFTEPCPKDIRVQYSFSDNRHVKCILRGGLPCVQFYSNPHVPSNPLLCCNSEGVRCDQSPFQPIAWETAYFKHFVTKSLQEYIENKLKRGVGDRSRELFLSSYRGRYYKYNQHTKEKDEWLKEHNIHWI